MPPLFLPAEQSPCNARYSMLLTHYLPDVRAIDCLMAVSVSSARASEGRQPLHSCCSGWLDGRQQRVNCSPLP